MQNINNRIAFCISFPAASTTATSQTRYSPWLKQNVVSGRPTTFTQSLRNITGRPLATQPNRQINSGQTVCTQSAIDDIPLESVPWTDPKSVPPHWHRPGVYGVYSIDGALQFVNASADVGKSISGHKQMLKNPYLVHSTRMYTVDSVNDDVFDEFAKKWIASYEEAQLPIPPGNTNAVSQWREQPSSVDADICFSGSIVAGTVEQRLKLEIENIISNHKCVLFIKGTSSMPSCGFSRGLIDLVSAHLNIEAGEFVCVDCLDSGRNPGLREGIKMYTNWPTIPQLYFDGEFVGGADIIADMHQSGELAVLLNS